MVTKIVTWSVQSLSVKGYSLRCVNGLFNSLSDSELTACAQLEIAASTLKVRGFLQNVKIYSLGSSHIPFRSDRNLAITFPHLGWKYETSTLGSSQRKTIWFKKKFWNGSSVNVHCIWTMFIESSTDNPGVVL